MATVNAGHNINDIKPLDATRQRLHTLSTELGVLRQAIESSDPLPPWATILRSSNLISTQIGSITEKLASTFNTHSDSTLSNFSLGGQPHVYPLPSFPMEQLNILEQLLKKKLEPEVADWIEKASTEPTATENSTNKLSRSQQEELWAWAKPRAGEIAADIPWSIDYTMAEQEAGVETVATGILRKLDDGLESEEEDEDDGDENDGEDKTMGGMKKQEPTQEIPSIPAKPMMPIDDMLRFMSTGVLPRPGGAVGAFPVSMLRG